MIAATLYCAIATFRMVAGVRSEDTVVIITQLPAAQAINATCDSPIETLVQRNRVSSISVNGCQLSAATRARLPNASLHAPVRQPLIVASRLSTVLIYSPSVSCRNSTVTYCG